MCEGCILTPLIVFVSSSGMDVTISVWMGARVGRVSCLSNTTWNRENIATKNISLSFRLKRILCKITTKKASQPHGRKCFLLLFYFPFAAQKETHKAKLISTIKLLAIN